MTILRGNIMNGLEIIECIAIEQVPDSVMFCLLLGVFSILVPTFVVYRLAKNGMKAFLAEVISGFIYIAVLIGLLESGVLDKPTGEYQYKVRITEDVGYVEFTDKYEVITENDDGTYIVQENNHIKE
jgi:hypothetical protein